MGHQAGGEGNHPPTLPIGSAPHANTHTHTHARTHARTRADSHTHAHTHTCTHTRTRICTESAVARPCYELL